MRQNNDYTVPFAIIAAAVIIGAAIIYTATMPKTNTKAGDSTTNTPKPTAQQTGNPSNVKPVNDGDHILGPKNASVDLIVFSDLECSYCKTFHETTLQQVHQTYGNQVAIVYRHYPLSIHPKAFPEAIAAECAADAGNGNETFWAFVDKIFAITPSDNGLDLTLIPGIVKNLGVDETKFTTCLDSGKFDQVIADDSQDGKNSGLEGTPYSIIIGKDGSTSVVNGAQPFSVVQPLIEKALGH